MNNLSRVTSPALCYLLLFFSLAGCFDTGLNQGSNKVLVNGSVLKGIISNADVTLLNSQGHIVWQGVSDSQGRFSAEYLPAAEQLFTLVASTTPESLMLCDARLCQVKATEKQYGFGDFIPGSQLATTAFKSALYHQDETFLFNSAKVEAQINGFSTLVVDVIEKQLNQTLSKQRYLQLAQTGSEIVAAAFGLDTDGIENLLQLPLPNINQPNSINETEPLAATIGLINAGQALNLTLLPQFSQALNDFIRSQQDQSAKAQLIELQHLYLSEVKNMVDSELLQINSEAVKHNISQYLLKGVNFTDLLTAIDELSIITGKKPAKIQASSRYWGASVDIIDGQWWWVSASESAKKHWLSLTYQRPFSATQIEIALSNRFQFKGGQVEASNDGENWLELVTTSGLDESLHTIDTRNVRHLTLLLDNDVEYSQYRYVFDPTPSIWLESLCLYKANSRAVLQPCQHSVLPVQTSASSFRLAAENVASSAKKTWWLSEFASGREEWLQMSYEQAFIAKRVTLMVKENNQGNSVTIQGSNDGENWTVLTELSQGKYPQEWTDEQGFRHLELELDNDQHFLHYRYHSLPASFVWLEYLAFSE